MPGDGLQLRRFDAGFDQLSHGDGTKVELQLPGFDAGELQQVFGQAREAHGMLADDLHEAAAIGRIVERAGQERFGETLDGRQGRAEFVRYIGHEVLPYTLQAAQVSDLVQHENGSLVAGGLHRGGRHGEASRANCTHDDLAGHLFADRSGPF